MILKLLKWYSRLTNKPIWVVYNGVTYYAQPNGSTIKTAKTKAGETVRGRRAECGGYIGDCIYTKEELDEMLKQFFKEGVWN